MTDQLPPDYWRFLGHYTARELAKVLGISVSYAHSILSGQVPPDRLGKRHVGLPHRIADLLAEGGPLASPSAETAHRLDTVLTLHEAATYLKVSPKTLARLAARGVIPCLRVGRRYRFALETLQRALGAGLLARPSGRSRSVLLSFPRVENGRPFEDRRPPARHGNGER